MHQIAFIVDNIISDLGYYSPIELLLRQGYLSYSHYEQWRSGEIEYLCEQIRYPDRTEHQLNAAKTYANHQELIAEPCEVIGWQGNRQHQILSINSINCPIEASLLNTQYQRPTDNLQLDLFFDNQGVQIASDLKNALINRHDSLAKNKLKQLQTASPSNPLCQQVKQLLDVINHHEKLTTPVKQLEHLTNQLTPLANALLKGQSRDMLAPYWQQLAQQLKTQDYDNKQPDLHAANCYNQISSWNESIKSILNTSNWTQYSQLYHLLAQAYERDHQRIKAIQTLCEHCWKFTQSSTITLQDHHIQQAHSDFIDLEFDQTWGYHMLPSWLLIYEPGLTRHLLSNTDSPKAFTLLQQLHLSELRGQKDLPQRKQLQDEHTELLSYYLRIDSGSLTSQHLT